MREKAISLSRVELDGQGHINWWFIQGYFVCNIVCFSQQVTFLGMLPPLSIEPRQLVQKYVQMADCFYWPSALAPVMAVFLLGQPNFHTDHSTPGEERSASLSSMWIAFGLLLVPLETNMAVRSQQRCRDRSSYDTYFAKVNSNEIILSENC
jgi:hypothetical protein